MHKIFVLLAATIPPLFYLPLIQGKPARTDMKVLLFGIAAGISAGVSVLILKALFLKGTIKPPSTETLTLTLFVSFIEAGLLEEFLKNGFYLVFWHFLSHKHSFKPFDYMALGVATGLGFGILENAYYALTPEFGKFHIVLDRTYTAVLAHMIMNGVFGFLRAQKVGFVWALIVCIFIHALYDFFALPSTLLGGILVRVFLLSGLGFCLWMGKTLWTKTRETN